MFPISNSCVFSSHTLIVCFTDQTKFSLLSELQSKCTFRRMACTDATTAACKELHTRSHLQYTTIILIGPRKTMLYIFECHLLRLAPYLSTNFQRAGDKNVSPHPAACGGGAAREKRGCQFQPQKYSSSFWAHPTPTLVGCLTEDFTHKAEAAPDLANRGRVQLQIGSGWKSFSLVDFVNEWPVLV